MLNTNQVRLLLQGIPGDVPVFIPGGGYVRNVIVTPGAVTFVGDENAVGTNEERENITSLKQSLSDKFKLDFNDPTIVEMATKMVAGGYRISADNDIPVPNVVEGDVVLTPNTGTFEAEGN